ncbi:MAG: hypothetical protein ACKO63_01155 [Nodosilinea sp.]
MDLLSPQDFPVNQLSDRYDLARSAVYTRLHQLDITPHRMGRRTFLTPPDLAQMDALHRFIQAGGTAPEFLQRRGQKEVS